MYEIFKTWLIECRLNGCLDDDEIEAMLEDRTEFKNMLEEFVRLCYFDVWVCCRETLADIMEQYPLKSEKKPEGE